MDKKMLSVLAVVGFSVMSFGSYKSTEKKDNLESRIVEQYSLMLQDAQKQEANPRTVYTDGTTKWCGSRFDWTEGFFPGSCWYLYELTQDKKWEEAAIHFQALNRNHTGASSHDLGFAFGCSYGNGYRLSADSSYLTVMKEAGQTLIGRFREKAGVIQSWDTNRGWQSERGWQCPVIIDNMMNLEMLFELTQQTHDSAYYKVAVSHANTTMAHHFRADASSYHVVDYDLETGEVRSRQTAQGYADESSWARGQAWGLYGYTVCYRYTKDRKYFDMATRIAHYIMNNQAIPADRIPYWDYNDPAIPNVPRDVSAASVTASALYELAHYASGDYKKYADEIMASLETEAYLAAVGTNNHFLLMHSVGSIPHGNEIDVPLNYADYYFLEALLRQKQFENK